MPLKLTELKEPKGRGRSGSENANWKGGEYFNNDGYCFSYNKEHPNSNKGGYVLKHRLVAEKVFGKILKIKNHVHHIDGNPRNNNTNNLVICENAAFHNLIHHRERALKASGNANYIKCGYCLEYDDPDNMYIHPGKNNGRHIKCQSEYTRKRRELNNAS